MSDQENRQHRKAGLRDPESLADEPLLSGEGARPSHPKPRRNGRPAERLSDPSRATSSAPWTDRHLQLETSKNLVILAGL